MIADLLFIFRIKYFILFSVNLIFIFYFYLLMAEIMYSLYKKKKEVIKYYTIYYASAEKRILP